MYYIATTKHRHPQSHHLVLPHHVPSIPQPSSPQHHQSSLTTQILTSQLQWQPAASPLNPPPPSPPTPSSPSNISPAVPKHVIVKLLAFTLAMIVLPIGSYFITVDTVFKGNSSYAGGFAALLANVVLIAYVIVAMNEDQSDTKSTRKSEGKKDQ
ncbi:Vacuolar ATPase assembly integral membrane protein VMA21 [Ophiocordyceps camponoti-floridani]|uniref:Vacuolar ATPase assembly integral membrane protein VMA21 n=1 Tax=Ophiocordyceps camponoti-floridani TaxID=2030778 RepID=A0A8H4VDL4_9HYPO|nr:Vacuolar ATPase assembly integral membrane protein VMA21 [Ophiocordyceps camponoti-floridani]